MYSINYKSDKKMNILFVTTNSNYYNNKHTIFNRMYRELIYFYNSKDINVYVLQPTYTKNKEVKSLKLNIKTYYYKQLKFLWFTLVIFTDFNPFYISKIIKLVKKYNIDLIHVEFPFGIICLRFFLNIPISYNSYNVESQYVDQIDKYNLKIPKFLRFFYSKIMFMLEKYATKFAHNINAINSLDKKQFINLYKIDEKKITISTWGYNEEILSNPIQKDEARKAIGYDKKKFIIIFHGSNFLANLEALNIIKDEIAPRIYDEDILFLIAGKLPPFKNRKNINFLGYIDDLKYFLYSADVAVTPILRGSGIKTKSFDYLSAAIPIISTKLGAAGLLLKNGVHGYIVNNSIEEIIKKILFLKNNPDVIKIFKENIRNLMLKNFNWEKILTQLKFRYKEIIILNKKS